MGEDTLLAALGYRLTQHCSQNGDVMKNNLPVLIFIGVLGHAAAAFAQEDELLREAFAGVAEIGKQWNGEVNVATQATTGG